MMHITGILHDYKKKRMDWFLFYSVLLLLIIGTVTVLSAVSGLEIQERIIKTHAVALFIGSLGFAFGWTVNYQIYSSQWKILYGFVIAVLLAVLIIGVTTKGSRSWIRLPFFSIQPTEIARIAIILIMASFMDRHKADIDNFYVIAKGFLVLSPIILLIMLQPDFSSLLITIPMVLSMFYCAGARALYLFIIVGFCGVTAALPVLWTYLGMKPDVVANNAALDFIMSLSSFGYKSIIACAALLMLGFLAVKVFNYLRIPGTKLYVAWIIIICIAGYGTAMVAQSVIKPYQRKRLEVFLAPQNDPRGAGYNLLQAQIALGSGGIKGKGLFSGTQGRLGFIPENHTDFILSVLGEEAGFIALMLVLGLYVVMLGCLLRIAKLANDNFGYLVMCGIFSMFTLYVLVNFGMTVGIVPVAGVPLPMISYGGSNLVATLWAVGIAQSVYARRVAFT